MASSLSRTASQCNGLADDTAAVQSALVHCALAMTSFVLQAGANCTARPLSIPSNSHIVLERGSRLQSASRTVWPGEHAPPPLLSSQRTRNVSIIGEGTLDGHGDQWWPKPAWLPISDRLRPKLLELDAVEDVVLEGFTIVNPARFAIDIRGGRRYRISRLLVRAPNYQTAPNTDGIDIAADDVHVSHVDVSNGDDSLCIKSPASNVLIENSIVRSGNGLVIGTSDVVRISNITFRNISALDTTFGCHIKFKGSSQSGTVSNVTFEDIFIHQSAAATRRRLLHFDHRGYAIGIHQNNQGMSTTEGRWLQARTSTQGDGGGVQISGITYRRVRADVLYAGEFKCNPGSLACTGIALEQVHLNASRGGCVFENVRGSNEAVEPPSCNVPDASSIPYHMP